MFDKALTLHSCTLKPLLWPHLKDGVLCNYLTIKESQSSKSNYQLSKGISLVATCKGEYGESSNIAYRSAPFTADQAWWRVGALVSILSTPPAGAATSRHIHPRKLFKAL